MTATVTTNLSLPRMRMLELLAACPTLQAAMPQYEMDGVTPITPTPTTCMQSIYSPWADDHWIDGDYSKGLVHPRPRVIVQHSDFVRDKLGTNYGGGMGSLFVTFEFKPDPAAGGDTNLELASFEETLGTILDELEARIGQDKQDGETFYSDETTSHFNVTRIELIAGPASCFPEEELGELFYAAIFLMHYIG